MRSRVNFELKNLTSSACAVPANFCFEVSSDGELQQIMAPILTLLSDGKIIEIIFCSQSVEAQCLALYDAHPEKIRLYRLPVLTYLPGSTLQNIHTWITAPVLILCRYDFFPELIDLGRSQNMKFLLLAASLKSFDKKNFLVKKYLQYCYESFDKIICSSSDGQKAMVEHFKISSDKIENFDFRAMHILERLKKSDATLAEAMSGISLFKNYLGRFASEDRIIFGNIWDYELAIFDSAIASKKYLVSNYTLVPHDLSCESIARIKSHFQKLEVPCYEITNNLSIDAMEQLIDLATKEPGIWILNMKGILCEFYSLFDHCYVGGGFKTSVHSLLEPFLAGNKIVCGPKTQRSTEYTTILEFNRNFIAVEGKLENVLNQFEMFKEIEDNHESFMQHFSGHNQIILFWLGLTNKGWNA